MVSLEEKLFDICTKLRNFHQVTPLKNHEIINSAVQIAQPKRLVNYLFIEQLGFFKFAFEDDLANIIDLPLEYANVSVRMHFSFVPNNFLRLVQGYVDWMNSEEAQAEAEMSLIASETISNVHSITYAKPQTNADGSLRTKEDDLFDKLASMGFRRMFTAVRS